MIVVIGTLAALTLNSFAGVRLQAQAAAIGDGLKKIEQSMILWTIGEGYTTWPHDPVSGGGTPFQQMIDETSFGLYMQQVPQVSGLNLEEWFYDNDGDSKGNCTSPYGGVNIVIRFLDNAELAAKVDKVMDDGDIACGKVRYVDRRIFYAVSNTQQVE